MGPRGPRRPTEEQSQQNRIREAAQLEYQDSQLRKIIRRQLAEAREIDDRLLSSANGDTRNTRSAILKWPALGAPDGCAHSISVTDSPDLNWELFASGQKQPRADRQHRQFFQSYGVPHEAEGSHRATKYPSLNGVVSDRYADAPAQVIARKQPNGDYTNKIPETGALVIENTDDESYNETFHTALEDIEEASTGLEMPSSSKDPAHSLEAERQPAAPPQIVVLPGEVPQFSNCIPTVAVFRDNRQHLAPLDSRDSRARKADLMQKLVKRYPDEMHAFFSAPWVQFAVQGGQSDATGIHIFIDWSNILISFSETLKRKRDIPPTKYFKLASMSFHSLAMILERGRPVARRVLVGSKPESAAVKEAKACAYEVSLLDRVTKIQETGSKGVSSGEDFERLNGFRSSDRNLRRQRKAEQGVDEILQGKMMESLLDFQPSTLVLASGDAAVAEFSDGFKAVVERALRIGWKVEVVSFKKSLSSAYGQPSFVETWQKQFRTILLDEFSEELFGV